MLLLRSRNKSLADDLSPLLRSETTTEQTRRPGKEPLGSLDYTTTLRRPRLKKNFLKTFPEAHNVVTFDL